MADATLKDVIDRLKREGQLTRNSSTGHSIRTVKEVLKEQHGQDRTLLQDMKDAFASISRSESGVESEETETTNPSGQTKGDIEERQRETDDFNSSLLEAQLENNKLMTDLIKVMKKSNKGGNNIGLFVLSILFIAFTNGYLLVPKPIRDFVIAYENGIQDQYTETVFLFFMFYSVVLIAYLFSLYRLWQLKKIGRNLFLITNVIMVFIFPFINQYGLYGPIDEIMNFISVFIFSAILIIVFYSSLAKKFKK